MKGRLLPVVLVLFAWLVPAGPAAAQRQREFRPPAGIVWERDVVYGTGGGRPLFLDIVRPEARAEGRRPVVVYIHGGGWRSGSKEGGLERNLTFARAGYATFTIDYRLVPESTFPGAVEDCKAAIRWIRASADRLAIDPDRIGVWGTSAGGHLAALLGTSGGVADLEGGGGHPGVSSRVACAVSCFGPTDFLGLPAHRQERGARSVSAEEDFLGGPLAGREDVARRASPISHVDADDPPFLFVHGDRDTLVPIAQSEVLHEALGRAGVESRLVRVEGGGHGVRGPEVDARMLAFFDRHLRDAEVEVSDEPIVSERRR